MVERCSGHDGTYAIKSETYAKAMKIARPVVNRVKQAQADHVAEGGPMNRELVTELVHAVHDSSAKSLQARKLHDAFGKIVSDGIELGDITRRHDAETLTEMILGAYYVLMFNYANLDDFPIEKQAAAVARFLADALAPHPQE